MRWIKRAGILLAAAAVTVGIFPAAVPAVTGSQVAKDGTYTGTATARIITTHDADGSGNQYDVDVTLTVSGGIFAKVDIASDYGKPQLAETNSDFVENRAGPLFVKMLEGKAASEETVNTFDAVTGATCSSAALKQAALNAVRKAPSAAQQPSTPTPDDPSMPGTDPTPDSPTTPGVSPLPDTVTKEEFRDGKPQLTAMAAADGRSVTVTWSAYPGADGYEVMRRVNGSGAFNAIKTAGQKESSYTDKDVKPGTTYNYTVVAVSTEWGKSDYDRSTKVAVPAYPASETESAKPGKAVIDSVASAAYNKLTVTWGVVENATGYVVSRSTAKKGTYKKVETVSADATSYTDTGLSTGKTYYYKVQAINEAGSETLKGTASAVKSGKCTLGKTAVAVTPEKKKAVVQWEKVDGANGYVVYRSTSKGKGYKAVKAVTKGTTLSFTNTKLKSKKTYYYKVRAYRKVSGKKVYSGYSAVVSAKTL